MVYFSTSAMIKAPTIEKIITDHAATAWRTSWVVPPPYNRRSTPAGAEVVARKPPSSVPTRPPMRCTPTTSGESSKPKRNLMLTASAHAAPAIAPTAMAPTGETDEHGG